MLGTKEMDALWASLNEDEQTILRRLWLDFTRYSFELHYITLFEEDAVNLVNTGLIQQRKGIMEDVVYCFTEKGVQLINYITDINAKIERYCKFLKRNQGIKQQKEREVENMISIEDRIFSELEENFEEYDRQYQGLNKEKFDADVLFDLSAKGFIEDCWANHFRLTKKGARFLVLQGSEEYIRKYNKVFGKKTRWSDMCKEEQKMMRHFFTKFVAATDSPMPQVYGFSIASQGDYKYVDYQTLLKLVEKGLIEKIEIEAGGWKGFRLTALGLNFCLHHAIRMDAIEELRTYISKVT